ncbi:MAG: type II toxin-antitoxin system PemK/MazF family toxin [Deltaproteobacteria bacterium]|nr:type II toxin-antitoxin system PemK/MazF family toxin [Deltaproteobacteria bacterium]
MTFELGDILLLNAFPYSSLGAVKKRPALVLADTGDEDLLLCRITSETVRDPYDLGVQDWKGAGLLLPSSIRLSKMATLTKRLVLRKLGRLGSPERRRVRSTLKKLFII